MGLPSLDFFRGPRSYQNCFHSRHGCHLPGILLRNHLANNSMLRSEKDRINSQCTLIVKGNIEVIVIALV